MKYFLFASVMMLMLCQCTPTQSSDNSTVATFRGLYAYGPEVSTLYDCASGQTYWVNDTSGKLSKSYAEVLLKPAWPYESAYVVIRGTLGAKTSEGLAKNYEGIINLTNIDSIASLNYSNCCQPFDFLGAGNEPFWSLFISETQGIIALKSLAVDEVYVFDYQKPAVNNGTYTYTSVQDTNKIEVKIVKKPSSDSMSDLTYPYQCNVTLNGVTNKGVALRQNDHPKE